MIFEAIVILMIIIMEVMIIIHLFHLLSIAKCPDCIIAIVTLFIARVRYDDMRPIIIIFCHPPGSNALIYGSCFVISIIIVFLQVGLLLGLKIKIDPYN